MKIIVVCGGRDFKRRLFLFDALKKENADLILHGNCPTGADYFANEFAKQNSIKMEIFDADWDKFGLGAGPVRNEKMMKRARDLVKEGNEVLVMAFPGGKGTLNAVENAKKFCLVVRRVR